MINHNILLLLVIFGLLLLCVKNTEQFVPGRVCTDAKANNYTNPVSISPSDSSDNCVCNYPNNIVCSKYFATNHVNPKYSSEDKRCFDSSAYNFEINDKIPDNSLCQYENNDTCMFPVSTTNINSLYDIIDNPEEFSSIHNPDGTVNYNNILRAGPCIPTRQNRSNKLDLYYRLFNRSAINLQMNNLDPVFNMWDGSGKITQTQLNASYDNVVRSYNFVEQGLNTNIDVLGYGLNIKTSDNNISYNDIVNAFNNQSDPKKRHVALAVSKKSDKYAIGIGKTKESAMDIALMNCILYDKSMNETDNKKEDNVDRPYNRIIYLFKKAKLMTSDEYNNIKSQINNNMIVSDNDKTLVSYVDKINENIENQAGILMINNDRYFKYPNNESTLNTCLESVKNISPKCFMNNNTINGNQNCNEVVMIRYDNNAKQCNVLQDDFSLIKNSEYNFSKSKLINEINVNLPVKMVNKIYNDYDCGENNVDCFIHSINKKRFCKSL